MSKIRTAAKKLPKNPKTKVKLRKAIFLDRDGVINKNAAEHDYIKTWDEFKLLNGVIEAIKYFHKKRYLVFVITNQAGISKGVVTLKNLKNIHTNLNLLLKKNGTRIDDFFYCPHSNLDNCNCRKPKPGMIYKAQTKYKIDLKKSFLIGDRDSDISAGKAAGLTTFKVGTDTNWYNALVKKRDKLF